MSLKGNMSSSCDNSEKIVTLGLIQMSMSENVASNLDKACSMIREAVDGGAQIVCLPELFRTPYFANCEKADRDWRDDPHGVVEERLSEIASEQGIVVVGGSIYEKIEGQSLGFNTTFVYGPDGKLIGKYRKTHIPHDAGFFEKNYFLSGDTGYKVFTTPFGRIAVLICFDQWFPEAARAVALEGADIVFYPTAIGNIRCNSNREGNWQESWEIVQRGHAIANHLVVATVNRVGGEGDSFFWGGSFITDQWGKVLCRGGVAEQVLVAKVDLGLKEFLYDGWRFFQNRQPSSYNIITRSAN
jgi:agmatine deiminase